MVRTVGSAIIDAPLAKVWGLVSDFGNLPRWFSGAASCDMLDGKAGNQIGAVRRVGQHGGAGAVDERLTGMSGQDHVMTYLVECVADLGSVKAAWGTKARVEFREITHGGGTFVEWSHESDVTEGDPTILIDFYRGVYAAFFRDLAKAAA